jgi:hypothetical protein
LGASKGRDHWKDLGIGGRMKLRWTLGSRDRMSELDLAGWLRIGSGDGLL